MNAKNAHQFNDLFQPVEIASKNRQRFFAAEAAARRADYRL